MTTSTTKVVHVGTCSDCNYQVFVQVSEDDELGYIYSVEGAVWACPKCGGNVTATGEDTKK